MYFLYWKYMNFAWDFIEVCSKGPIKHIPALAQTMAWRRPGDKALSEPMVAELLTHVCVIRSQWVKVGAGLDIWVPCGRHFVKCNNRLTSPGFHCITLYTAFQKLSTQSSLPLVFAHLGECDACNWMIVIHIKVFFISSYNDHRVLHTLDVAADNGITSDFRLTRPHWNNMARLSCHAKYTNPLQMYGWVICFEINCTWKQMFHRVMFTYRCGLEI